METEQSGDKIIKKEINIQSASKYAKLLQRSKFNNLLFNQNNADFWKVLQLESHYEEQDQGLNLLSLID